MGLDGFRQALKSAFPPSSAQRRHLSNLMELPKISISCCWNHPRNNHCVGRPQGRNRIAGVWKRRKTWSYQRPRFPPHDQIDFCRSRHRKLCYRAWYWFWKGNQQVERSKPKVYIYTSPQEIGERNSRSTLAWLRFVLKEKVLVSKKSTSIIRELCSSQHPKETTRSRHGNSVARGKSASLLAMLQWSTRFLQLLILCSFPQSHWMIEWWIFGGSAQNPSQRASSLGIKWATRRVSIHYFSPFPASSSWKRLQSTLLSRKLQARRESEEVLWE